MPATPPEPSGHPGLGHTLHYGRDAFGFVDRGVDEVGDVFRVRLLGTGDLYVLAHPDHVERVLVTERDAFAKSESFDRAFGESIVATGGEQWERQRETMESFFYPARVRSYADEMVERTTERIGRWRDGQRLSLHQQLRALALENLFGTLFDRRLAIDGDERLREAANDLNAWFEPTSWALPAWIPTPARRRFRRATATLEAETRRLLREREREGAGDDLLSTLVTRRGDGDVTDDEIVDQVVGLVFAGHDTTGLTLTFALHCLGTHPDVRERFHAEIDDVLGDRDPTLADVGDLAVTERVVLETMRRYPPLHTIPRATTRSVELDGYELPADSRVHLSLYSVHRDERFWTDPDAFRPERWRDESPQSKGYAFVPFGGGPRSCLGRRFAMLEATLVLATVGRRYRLDPLEPLSLAPQMTTQPSGTVPARVVER